MQRVFFSLLFAVPNIANKEIFFPLLPKPVMWQGNQGQLWLSDQDSFLSLHKAQISIRTIFSHIRTKNKASSPLPQPTVPMPRGKLIHSWTRKGGEDKTLAPAGQRRRRRPARFFPQTAEVLSSSFNSVGLWDDTTSFSTLFCLVWSVGWFMGQRKSPGDG